MPARFVPMKQVAEERCLSEAQVYALVRSKDLPAVKIGGRVSGASNGAASRNGSSGSTATPNGSSTSTPFTGTGDKRTSDPPPQELTS